MKRNFKLFVFVFLFLLLFFLKLNAESTIPFFDPLKTISMDFKDAGLKDVLKALSIQSGLNFIAAENVEDRQITLYLDRVPLKNTMDNLFKANNLDYELDKDSNTFIVKSWGKLEVETVTKVFALKYATVSSSSLKEEMADIKSATTVSSTGGTTGTSGGGSGKWKIEDDTGITIAVKKLLSQYGSVIEDFRTNSLVVTDTPARMTVISKVITSLDVRVPQVMLEVEMLDVSKNVVDKIGFDFGDNPFTLILPGEFARRGADFFLGTVADRKKNITSSSVEGKVILGATFAQTLDFLRTNTDTKYLARPKLLTLNNETAEITITSDEVMEAKPILGTSTTGAVSITGYDFKRATELNLTKEGIGISLRVTPQINEETGEITMFIYPKSSSSNSSLVIAASVQQTVLDPEVRSTKSVVRVKDGETVVLGGLIHQNKKVALKKLPILGDIPFLGVLFRHKDQTKDLERELIVFITPHIIKEGMELAQAKKVTIPAREQSTASGVKRELAINAGLNSFEIKKK